VRFVIEWFTEDYAVCRSRNGRTVNIDRRKIPPEAGVGDVIEDEDGVMVINFLESMTQDKKE
jgi:hypothetical protein